MHEKILKLEIFREINFNFISYSKLICFHGNFTEIVLFSHVSTKLNKVVLGRFRSFLGRPRESTSGQVAKNRLDRPRIDRLTRLVFI